MVRKHRKHSTGHVRAVSDGERVALREGIAAKNEGRPRKNPYVDVNGEIIPIFRALHAAWFLGYDGA